MGQLIDSLIALRRSLIGGQPLGDRQDREQATQTLTRNVTDAIAYNAADAVLAVLEAKYGFSDPTHAPRTEKATVSGAAMKNAVGRHQQTPGSHTSGFSEALYADLQQAGSTAGLYDAKRDVWRVSLRDLDLMATRQKIAASYFLTPPGDDAAPDDIADYITRQGLRCQELDRVLEAALSGTMTQTPTVTQSATGIQNSNEYNAHLWGDIGLGVRVGKGTATPAEVERFEAIVARRVAEHDELSRRRAFDMEHDSIAAMEGDNTAEALFQELRAAHDEAKAMVTAYEGALPAKTKKKPGPDDTEPPTPPATRPPRRP